MNIIRLNKCYDTKFQEEHLEIFAYSQIAAYMIYPCDENARKKYMALAFNKMNEVLLTTYPTKHAIDLFYNMVISYFGTWLNYTKNLIELNFIQQGKGSIPDKAWVASISGLILNYSINMNVNITQSCLHISNEIQKSTKNSEFDDIAKPDGETARKKYWSTYKNVSHFWAAMKYFEMPDANDSIIRLDIVRLNENVDPERSSGWRLIWDLAKVKLDATEQIKYEKARKPLLSSDTALRIVFED